MALRFIFGSSGSGKSRLLFDTVLKRAQDHPDGRFIVLVPEQFTLQTQRDLVQLSERGGILNIDVLSFTRLAWRVFEQTGVEKKSVLSETGKSLLLRLIASREAENLPFLSSMADRPGMISEMKSILSELDQYGITPDTLLESEKRLEAEGGRPGLARKLGEIRRLQEVFERYQADHFITGEKLPRILCRKAPLDPTLRGAELFLDGYTGFTPAQLDVIAVLLPIAADITVTVTIDPSERELCSSDPLKALVSCSPREHELFALSKRTAASLIKAAHSCGVSTAAPVILDGSRGRMKSGSELAWLEKHLFRTGREGRMPFAGSGQQVQLRCCADPYDEVVCAAVTVRELVLRGMRYRDIAVVCGSLKDYAEYVKRVFSLYEIPFFIDRSSPVILNPAFEFAESAIDVLEKNYSYESIMRLIRTGLILDTENGEADLLENYLLAAGIRGRRAWSEPFSRSTKSGDESLLAAAECARIGFTEKFSSFSEVMKKGKTSLRDRAQALWELIIACGIPRKLDILRDRYREAGMEERASEYDQVLGVISDVLDEASGLIGEEIVTRKQFMEILRAGFSEAKIGIIPPGIDEVHIGDLQRTRLEHIRAVIFLGLNEGVVPGPRAMGGVLNDMEREYLKDRNVHLAPTAREEANIQQFYLYLTLTKPSDLLVMSWSGSSRDGKELRRAPVVNAAEKLFPGKTLLPSASDNPYFAVTSPRTGLRILADGIASWLGSDGETAAGRENKLKELLKIYEKTDGKWKETVSSILQSAAKSGMNAQIDPETAARLYGSVLYGSISRLERFAACPFRQYAEYGLKLTERDTFTIENPDIGTLLHKSIELFSAKMNRNPEGYTWDSIPDKVRDRWAEEALYEASALKSEQLYRDSERGMNIIGRCVRIMKRSVRTIQTQVRSGLFVPARFEVSFSEDDLMIGAGELPGGVKLQLKGRIDRIDECDDPQSGKLYVKIIDYKSSGRKVDLDRFIDGEQLQLVVYMDAAARMEQKANSSRSVVCAGMFYYTMQNPVLSSDKAGDDPEIAMLKEMKVSGLLNESPDVVRRLDKTLSSGSGSSLVIPATINNDGSLRANSSSVTADQIEDLRAYSREKIRRISASILSGEIRPHPSRYSDNETACRYCGYSDVCHFSELEKGMEYNVRTKRGDQERWSAIRQLIRPEVSEQEETGGAGDGR